MSYSLYLLHLPVGSLSMTLLAAAGLEMGAAFVVATVIGISVAWVSYRLAEIPSQALGRRLSGARHASRLALSPSI